MKIEDGSNGSIRVFIFSWTKKTKTERVGKNKQTPNPSQVELW
jgi:hypothetical protein